MENIRFDCTCGACPEQYDVYCDNKLIAYVRLRWGTVSCKMNDEIIYIHDFDDNFKGCFAGDERDYHLDKIKQEIIKELNNEKDI